MIGYDLFVTYVHDFRTRISHLENWRGNITSQYCIYTYVFTAVEKFLGYDTATRHFLFLNFQTYCVQVQIVAVPASKYVYSTILVIRMNTSRARGKNRFTYSIACFSVAIQYNAQGRRESSHFGLRMELSQGGTRVHVTLFEWRAI